MGYNRRAIALQKCAERVMEEFAGILPADPEILATFPGIGKATASSICAFAFSIPGRFYRDQHPPGLYPFLLRRTGDVNDKEILPLVELALFRENPRVWYWALMDVGTELKKTVTNPNHRSTHYAPQARFEGSDWQIRGEILKQLIGKSPLSEKELIEAVGADPERAGKLIMVPSPGRVPGRKKRDVQPCPVILS